MQLTDRIHLVGSGAAGFSLTDPLDCHVYLIDGATELALIDTGAGRALDSLLASIVRAGFDTARIAKIVLTHAHFDHAGGCAALHAALPEARVCASAAIASVLRDGVDEAISLDIARAAGLYPPDATLQRCPVDVELREGDLIEVGDLALAVLDTPGHADGHISLLLDHAGTRSLFSGDAVFAGGKILLQPTHDCRVDAHVDSLRKLRGLDVDRLLPGHFAICLTDGQAHIEAANADLDAVALPPQGISRR